MKTPLEKIESKLQPALLVASLKMHLKYLVLLEDNLVILNCFFSMVDCVRCPLLSLVMYVAGYSEFRESVLAGLLPGMHFDKF